MRRITLGIVSFLLLVGGVDAQPSTDTDLARKLYGIFLSIPSRPEILKGSNERRQFEFIAKRAADPMDGIHKLGVERHDARATLWLLTREAEMSGRMALYTLQFEQVNGTWLVRSGTMYINGPSAMPKDIVQKCTLLATELR